jgi:hypothetical protein
MRFVQLFVVSQILNDCRRHVLFVYIVAEIFEAPFGMIIQAGARGHLLMHQEHTICSLLKVVFSYAIVVYNHLEVDLAQASVSNIC